MINGIGHTEFKDSELGRIPKTWERRKLGKLGKFSTSSVDKKTSSQEDIVKLLNYMDVYQNSRLDESFPFQQVTAPAKQIESSSVVNGDVFFTPSSETPDDIGHSTVFIGNMSNIVHSYHTIRFRPYSGETFDDEFKAYAFKSESTYQYFRQRATGSTRFTVSLPVFENLEVSIPPLPEQKKIASILTSVDEVIENTQKQIDKLQDLKKATMNELLTQGIGHTEFKDNELGRIPKNWERRELGKLGKFSKGKGIYKSDLVSQGLPCLRYAEIYTDYEFLITELKSRIPKEIADASRRLMLGDIVFAGSGETVEEIGKSVAYLSESEAYVGGDAVILTPTVELDSAFLSYQLNDDERRKQLRKMGQGSSVIHIYSSELEKLRLHIPPLPEQKKIVSILSSIDKDIETRYRKLQQIQSLKKSLMQDLLTGKVRVKVN